MTIPLHPNKKPVINNYRDLRTGVVTEIFVPNKRLQSPGRVLQQVKPKSYGLRLGFRVYGPRPLARKPHDTISFENCRSYATCPLRSDPHAEAHTKKQ